MHDLKKIKYNKYGQPVKEDNLFYEAMFWLIVFGIFIGGSCVLWYVIFRAIGIVV
jgi:hypothetical protein